MPRYPRSLTSIVRCPCGASEQIAASSGEALGNAIGLFRAEHRDCRERDVLVELAQANPYATRYASEGQW